MFCGTFVCKRAVLVFFLVLALPTRLVLLFIACTLTVGCVLVLWMHELKYYVCSTRDGPKSCNIQNVFNIIVWPVSNDKRHSPLSTQQDTFNKIVSPHDILRFSEGQLVSKVHVQNPVFDHVPPDLITLFVSNMWVRISPLILLYIPPITTVACVRGLKAWGKQTQLHC